MYVLSLKSQQRLLIIKPLHNSKFISIWIVCLSVLDLI